MSIPTLVTLPQHTQNKVIQAIWSRRAVRKYLDKPVERAVIDELVDAGRMAPSAINLQPYRFIIVDNRELIATFGAAVAKAAEPFFHLAHGVDLPKTDDPIFYHAPVVIFIAGPKDDDWAGLDIGMCAQNIMLAAKGIGLDSCPVGLATLIAQTEVYPSLGLSATEKIFLAVVIGYGDEQPEFHGRKKDNAVYLLK